MQRSVCAKTFVISDIFILLIKNFGGIMAFRLSKTPSIS